MKGRHCGFEAEIPFANPYVYEAGERETMLALVKEMVDNGYSLFNETVEQFVDRLKARGINAEDLRAWRDRFMAERKGA